MVSVSKIERLAVSGRVDALLEEIGMSGHTLPPALRAGPVEPGALRLAAAGLGLLRAVELTYQPVPASVRLAETVCGMFEHEARAGNLAQREGGSGGGAGCAAGWSAAVQIAAGALRAFLDQDATGGRWLEPRLRRRFEAVVERVRPGAGSSAHTLSAAA